MARDGSGRHLSNLSGSNRHSSLLSAAIVISLCFHLRDFTPVGFHFIPFPPLGCSSGRGNTFLRVDNGTWESLSLVVSKHWPTIGDSQIQCLRKQTMNKMNQHVQMSTIVEHAHIPWLFLSYIGCWILDVGYCWNYVEVPKFSMWNSRLFRGDAQCSAKSPGALEAGYPTSLMEKQWKIHLKNGWFGGTLIVGNLKNIGIIRC